jgi:hypothetical protein
VGNTFCEALLRCFHEGELRELIATSSKFALRGLGDQFLLFLVQQPSAFCYLEIALRDVPPDDCLRLQAP